MILNLFETRWVREYFFLLFWRNEEWIIFIVKMDSSFFFEEWILAIFLFPYLWMSVVEFKFDYCSFLFMWILLNVRITFMLCYFYFIDKCQFVMLFVWTMNFFFPISHDSSVRRLKKWVLVLYIISKISTCNFYVLTAENIIFTIHSF